MARPKEFDRDEALKRALEVFWEKGYEATSIQDLVERTGVQRQSLYDTFGDKHALYAESLHRYASEADAWLKDLTTPAASPLAHLKATFMSVVDGVCTDTKGCMLMNAAVERGDTDPTVAECVHEGRARMERAFTALVRLAQGAGEVSKSVSASGAARTLVTLLWGMRAMARTEPERSWLKSVVDHTVTSLAS